jgi:hypothetical protein
MNEGANAKSARKVEWDEVEMVAPDLFEVWVGGSEVAWAERAWQMLAEAGLTSFIDDLGQTRVLVRFIILGLMYRRFCWVAQEESTDEEMLIREACDGLELPRFRLGQLMGPRWEADAFGSTDADLTHAAVFQIYDDDRAAIRQALVHGFGGESELGDALCQTKRLRRKPDEDDESGGLNDEDLSTAARIFEWINQGMGNL